MTASYWDAGEFIAASYKLMIPHPTGENVMTGLYNLNKDPYEMTNLLAGESGASKYNAKVKELESCFNEWTKRTTKNK